MAENNPFQKRCNRNVKLEQTFYVDRKRRSDVNTYTIQLYAYGESCIVPGGNTELDKDMKMHFYRSIEYISEGAGEIRCNNRSYKIRKGDIISINPRKSSQIFAPPDREIRKRTILLINNPVTEYILVHGTVSDIDIFRLKEYTRFEHCLDQIAELVRTGHESIRDELSILAYSCLNEITKNIKSGRKTDKFSQIIFAISQAPQYYSNIRIISDEFCISERSLFYLFKKRLNCTPMQFVIQRRLENSRWYLLYQEDTLISTIAEICGYSSVAFFSREFKKAFGVSPREYRKKQIV